MCIAMRIKRIIRRHLTFSRSERWILIYFAVILLAIFLSKNFIVGLFTRTSREASMSEHRALVASMQRIKDSLTLAHSVESFDGEKEIALFNFDPNAIDYDTWIELGIPAKIANVIINYRKSGGEFYTAADLLKVYGFKREYLDRLLPYMQFEKEAPVSQTAMAPDSIAYFIFDPNQIENADWVQLGISPAIAERIGKYLDKGGAFRKVEDVKKIYGFEEADFLRLEPYMVISYAEDAGSTTTPGEISTREINAMTKNDLMILGFSQKVAWDFINYRNKLGGFYSKGQIQEVWGINRETADSIFAQYTLDSAAIMQIPINSATEEELKNHPYISDEFAAAVIRYRNETGKFYSVSEIVKAGYLSKKTFEKLVHYLTL